MEKGLKNTVVIITGAASGMGREMAIQAAAKPNYHVIGTDVNTGELEKTRSLAGAIETHILDVSKAEEISAFSEKIIPTLKGRKLVLINNAGVGLAFANVVDISMEDFEWVMNINLYGVVRMTKAFLPYMLQHNAGHILNTSSVFGLAGTELSVPYCTTKFGVRGFAEALRMELIETNIRTTSIHPGGIRTNIANNTKITGKISEEEQKKNADKFNKNVMTSADSAARQILRCVETGKQRLVIGADAKAVDLVARLFPVAYSKIIVKQVRKNLN